MAKHKMIPPESQATDMVDERPKTAQEVAEMEAKQQIALPLDEPKTEVKIRGRKAKVNMVLPSGAHLEIGKVPKLEDEDVAMLEKNWGHALHKVLE